MTNLDSILKSRDITLPTKVRLVKAMVFPVVMYGCESWTMKKAEHRRIDAFEVWCWRKLLRVPWTARKSNQSILKEISPGCSLEGLMLKLKLQYFGHLMWRTDSLEKTLMLGKLEGRRRKEWQRMRWLDGIIDSMDMSLSNSGRQWRTGKPGVLQSMGLQRVGCDWATEWQPGRIEWLKTSRSLRVEFLFGCFYAFSLSASLLLFFLKQTLRTHVGDSSTNLGLQSQKAEIKVAQGLWPYCLHGYTHTDKCAFPNTCI